MRLPRTCKAPGQVAAAAYSLVAGRFSTSISILDFDGKAALTPVGSLDLPVNPSWIEPGPNGVFYTLSDDKVAISLKLNGNTAEVTKQVPLEGCEGPTHITKLADGIVVACYGGGAVVHVGTDADGTLTDTQTMVQLPFAYADSPAAPQDMSRAHGSIATDDGKIWVADLGSDSVWRIAYDGKLTLEEEYKVPKGFGPRHLATPDGKAVYAIGEMGNAVIALQEGKVAENPVSILPADLPEGYGSLMGGGEIVAHPTTPTTFYASNRNQLSIVNTHADYVPPKGDSVAVLSVETPGAPAKVIKEIVTGCDHIRGMRTSPDGNFVAVAGLNNAIVEVYSISGAQKEEWTLVATHEGLESVTDVTFFAK